VAVVIPETYQQYLRCTSMRRPNTNTEKQINLQD
jgi:hypothetical protein